MRAKKKTPRTRTGSIWFAVSGVAIITVGTFVAPSTAAVAAFDTYENLTSTSSWNTNGSGQDAKLSFPTGSADSTIEWSNVLASSHDPANDPEQISDIVFGAESGRFVEVTASNIEETNVGSRVSGSTFTVGDMDGVKGAYQFQLWKADGTKVTDLSTVEFNFSLPASSSSSLEDYVFEPPSEPAPGAFEVRFENTDTAHHNSGDPGRDAMIRGYGSLLVTVSLTDGQLLERVWVRNNRNATSWNNDRLSLRMQRTVTVEDAALAFEKTSTGVVEDGPGRWKVSYDLVVTNTGPGQTTYALSDDLTGYSDTVEVVSSEVTSAPLGASVNTGWNGDSDKRVITSDMTIAPGSTATPTVHTYQLEVTVGLKKDDNGKPLAAPRDLITCSEPGQPDRGLFNQATATAPEGAITDSACNSVPLVTVTKTIQPDGEPKPLDPAGDPGLYTITYTLVVENPTGHAVRYDLNDRLRYGSGVTVEPGSVTATAVDPVGTPVNGGFNGDDVTSIATGVSIEAAAKHTYTVTAQYRVNLPSTASTDSDPSDCELTGSEQGTGLLNEASAESNTFTTSASACRPVSEVEQNKSLVSANPVGNGQWRVIYHVTVKNLGSAEASYSVADELHFGSGISIAEASASGPSTAAATWNGQSNQVLATDTTILGNGNAEYADHQYVITVLAEVPLQFERASGAPDPTSCGTDPVNYQDVVDRAFLNVSTLRDASGNTSNDDACAPVPAFTIDKTASESPAVRQPDGSWVVTYRIAVTNTGSASGSYDLDDTLQFDERVQVQDGTVTGPEGVPVNPDWTGSGAESSRISTGVTLAASATHRYQVDVTFTLNHSDGDVFRSTLSCDSVAPGERTGLKNAATMMHNSRSLTDSACPPAPETPTAELNKTITAGPSVTKSQRYRISYTIEVKNTGSVDTSYDLVDDLQFGDGFTVDTARVEESPSAATVLTTWTEQGEPGAESLVVTRNVPLAETETHMYTITVTGFLPTSALRSPTSVNCPAEGSFDQSGGFHNVAMVQGAGLDLKDDACAEPKTSIVLRNLEDEPTPTPGGGLLGPLAVTGANQTSVVLTTSSLAVLLAILGVSLLRTRRVRSRDETASESGG